MNRPIINYLFAISFFALVHTNVLGQNTEAREVSAFKIEVNLTWSKIELKCIKGCAWKELSFDRSSDKPQAINAYGMTAINKKQSNPDPTMAKFFFTIKKEEKGIMLKGISGTAWTQLGFTNSYQAINEMGMTSF